MDYDRNPYSGGNPNSDTFWSGILIVLTVIVVIAFFYVNRHVDKPADTRTPEEIQKAREEKADNAGKVGHSFLKGLAEGK